MPSNYESNGTDVIKRRPLENIKGFRPSEVNRVRLGSKAGHRKYPRPTIEDFTTWFLARKPSYQEKLMAITHGRNLSGIELDIRDMNNFYDFCVKEKNYGLLDRLIRDIELYRSHFDMYVAAYKRDPNLISKDLVRAIPNLKKDLKSLEKKVQNTLSKVGDAPYARLSKPQRRHFAKPRMYCEEDEKKLEKKLNSGEDE